MTKAIIYACSHRKGGNTDRAADLLLDGVRSAGGDADIIHLRDHTVEHCLACGFCDKSVDLRGRERCVLGAKDDAWDLFKPMFTAPTVIFASPIYFYNLPSRLKTWIDRGQQFWAARMTGEDWMVDLPRRTAHAVMAAGRPSGDRLFEGASLTLKYFLVNFNFNMTDPLVFRGVDQKKDLVQNADTESRIKKLGTTAWSSSV